MVDSIQRNGLAGIQRGLNDAVKQASKVANAFTEEGDGDLVGPLVALSQDKLQVAASAKVVKVGDELDQAVLDILA